MSNELAYWRELLIVELYFRALALSLGVATPLPTDQPEEHDA